MKNMLAYTRDLLQAVETPAFIINSKREVVFVNNALEVKFNGILVIKTGQPAALIEQSPDKALFDEGFHIVLQNGGPWESKIRYKTTEGKIAACHLCLSGLGGGSHGYDHCVVVMIAPEALPETNDMAISDGKTATLLELPDAFLFYDRLDQTILNARRNNKYIALLMFSVDQFDAIRASQNIDSQALLEKVTERLKGCIRMSDTLAHLQRERFAMVMLMTAVKDSIIVAEKVVAAVDRPLTVSGQKLNLGFSIGISLWPDDSDSAEELIAQAESALAFAQSAGANRYQFFADHMNTRARERNAMEKGLRRALAKNELVLYYQPKIEPVNETIIGMEGLIRWMDPKKGMISPGEFIPLAEETGLIRSIGMWVIEKACSQVKAWQDKGLPRVEVAVNVSTRQFLMPGFVDQVAHILDTTGLPPDCLELEITESVLMQDADAAVKSLEDLRSLGLHLAIDDFGTGYSSLSYLSRFPFTTLKIDRAFIRNLENNPKDEEIVRAIIGLSRGLNLAVVGEGAEILEQVKFLRDHHCTSIQGYYYSKPVSPDEFELMLLNGIQVN